MAFNILKQPVLTCSEFVLACADFLVYRIEFCGCVQVDLTFNDAWAGLMNKCLEARMPQFTYK